MRFDTRELGTVDIDPGDIVEFSMPILGFESYKKFAILSVPDAEPFHWLQSLEEKELAFPVVRAEELGVSYRADPEDMDCLDASSQEEVTWWVLVVIPADGGQLRVNLRAPVLVNPKGRLAAQIIVRDDYPVSWPLDPAGGFVPPSPPDTQNTKAEAMEGNDACSQPKA